VFGVRESGVLSLIDTGSRSIALGGVMCALKWLSGEREPESSRACGAHQNDNRSQFWYSSGQFCKNISDRWTSTDSGKLFASSTALMLGGIKDSGSERFIREGLSSALAGMHSVVIAAVPVKGFSFSAEAGYGDAEYLSAAYSRIRAG